MKNQFKHALRLALVAALAAAGPVGAADGDASFNGWIEQFRHRTDAEEWQNAMLPSATGTAFARATPTVHPLRTFNAYLAYLGQRMRVDAGSPGPLLKGDRGTDSFDRYIEEINYRIQTLYRAEDAFGQ